ncbi:hypothetical protein [Allostreptomyces psammosilenae]|uniref:Uncharacterized protein n=1 Tax=Allostreptomyces psammosilenae TaxID=1892865 RepID=A0A852ZY02_9ACTN|nr:hypothetical protein [Allostreptomyces psammosilenae]NYI07253.1 hypothetical protein [Allostreptomyces psammosilenae]
MDSSQTTPQGASPAPEPTPGASAEAATSAAEPSRQVRRAARWIAAFAAAHGGGADGQAAHIGRGRTRLVLVADDGTWGDQVLPGHAEALRAAELAGVRMHEEFPPEVTERITTGVYEWRRMAGIQVGGR